MSLRDSRLLRFYGVQLLVIVGVLVASELWMDHYLERIKYYGKIINTAGRQRMLSQRLNKLAHRTYVLHQSNTDHSIELERLQTLSQEFDDAYVWLRVGSESVDMNDYLNDSLRQQLAEIAPFQRYISETARRISQEGAAIITSEMLDAITWQDRAFIPRMEQIVDGYARESENRIATLRWLERGVSGLIGLVVVVQLLFWVRPVVRRLRDDRERLSEQNEQLESFAFMTSHNLRRPLANIIGISRLMEYQRTLGLTPDDSMMAELGAAAQQLDEVVAEMSLALRGETIGELRMRPAELNVSEKPVKDVLLVDDDPLMFKLVAFMARMVSPDIKVRYAEKPDESIRELLTSNQQPEYILLDLNMPVVNGWAYLDGLMMIPNPPRVCILSSSIDIEDQIRAFAYPMVVGYLVKPVSPTSLRTALGYLQPEVVNA